MISEFEQRLADVLGARLRAPFAGRVRVAPGDSAQNQPLILVGVTHAEPAPPELGHDRPERVPGANDPRRVVRLKCAVGLTVRPGQNGGRAQQLLGVDALLFALDAEDVRKGTALQGPGDPGFLIHQTRLVAAEAPLDPALPGVLPPAVTLEALGWFWPVGSAGQAGDKITLVHLRGMTLPIEILPEEPRLVAGGGPVEFTVLLGTNKTLRFNAQPAPPAPLPFGALAFTLVAPGGRPGLGTLSGGAAGAAGVRVVPVNNATATVTYTPPAEPATEELVFAPENGSGGLGLEMARVTLRVKEA